MNPRLIEETYPVEFREEESIKLGSHIKNRRSVVMTGMKRVGISNYLRFFLNHREIKNRYLDEKDYFFVAVDLNDLVEREIFPFWILTFKRLEDGVENSDLPSEIKKEIGMYFLDSIQSQDLFLTIDYLRKSLLLLCDKGYFPTIFFLRFDRLKGAMTHDLFANILGLLDATHNRLSYVFTSARELENTEPEIFTRHSMLVFSDNMYVKPAKGKDTKVISESSIKQYNLELDKKIVDELLKTVDGHTQYLHFALIALRESGMKINPSELFEFLKNDERIALLSEELWESLTANEQEILIKVITQKKLSDEELKKADYLINTGFFTLDNFEIFNPIFDHFIRTKADERKRVKMATEFSKKENLLLKFLEENKNEICEREQIIEAVWPETESLGVTDWAIDRLVARVRTKLKDNDKHYEIVTVKTRGYKLIDR
jgi:DNA-binding winged helix-turn-helix (wHTH) protein